MLFWGVSSIDPLCPGAGRVTAQNATRGKFPEVKAVREDSVANGRLRKGDQIVSIDGERWDPPPTTTTIHLAQMARIFGGHAHSLCLILFLRAGSKVRPTPQFTARCARP